MTTNILESVPVKKNKIGQYVVKIWTTVLCLSFCDHGIVSKSEMASKSNNFIFFWVHLLYFLGRPSLLPVFAYNVTVQV